MKTFYVMEKVNWKDRRKGEIAIRYIKAKIEVTRQLVVCHISKRLNNKPSQLYQ